MVVGEEVARLREHVVVNALEKHPRESLARTVNATQHSSMRRPCVRGRWLTTLLAGLAVGASAVADGTAAAQLPTGTTLERPVAFDSTHRVFAITPRLAARLSLAAPLWSIVGDYR